MQNRCVFGDLATYFYENVVCSLDDYLGIKNSEIVGRSRDIRAAIIAATGLYHIREHLPPNNALSHAVVSSRCPDYSLLGDVVNASKHSVLTRGNPQIVNATQIEERIVTTEYQDGQGLFHSHEKVVLVKLANGSEKDVLEIMINVMNFWQNHLHSIGVISKSRHYSIPIVTQPRLRAECKESRLNFEVVKGLRFHQTFRLQKYNYTTSKIELMDCSHLQFKIYKPGYELELILENKSLGKEFRKKIVLNEEENVKYSSLKTEREKQTYLENLPSAQQALRELTASAGLSK